MSEIQITPFSVDPTKGDKSKPQGGLFQKWVVNALGKGDVQCNGTRPFDIRVHNSNFYRRVAMGGSLGLGEAYMDGWWDCDSLDEFFARILAADVSPPTWGQLSDLLVNMHACLLNCQSRARAFVVGERHYDAGNDLYKLMLDGRMTYTCGYWRNSSNLEEAQEAKLDLVCRKIGLKPGHRVLDVGCGWGSFASFAAERYGAHVTGITISREQLALAKERCHGLPVDLQLCDYRDFRGQFDRVVSLGMMEHVGYRNYGTYAKMIHRSLKPEGLALIQVIGSPRTVIATDPWLERYIFPNSMLPSVRQIGKAIDSLLRVEDWHSFGDYYDNTLMAWHSNFVASWDQISSRYDERFYRMWRYYLLLCAGIFRARRADLWQIVLSKGDYQGVYEAVR